MITVAEHYDKLLARHFTWMSGGHDAKIAENLRVFQQHNFTPKHGRRALDLGCGSGFQSLALAELGYDVTSIDTSATLLAELKTRAHGKCVKPVLGDMRDPENYGARRPFEAAVCMGDSLTHLDSFDEVEAMLGSVRGCLETGAKLMLGFRDLRPELSGLDRVFPVRADADKIMTVFLEYEAKHVVVHDLVYTRENEQWIFTKSAYRKLRLSAQRVVELLMKMGFQDVSHAVQNGFSVIVADWQPC